MSLLRTTILMRQRSGRFPWGRRLEPLPDDIRSAMQSAKCKRQKRAGEKTVTRILINQQMKKIFLSARENQNRNGERFEGSSMFAYFFFTWKFFCNCKNLLDKRGNARWPENEVQWTKKSTTTSTENLHRQHIAPLRWIKSWTQSFWFPATDSQQWKRRKKIYK